MEQQHPPGDGFDVPWDPCFLAQRDSARLYADEPVVQAPLTGLLLLFCYINRVLIIVRIVRPFFFVLIEWNSSRVIIKPIRGVFIPNHIPFLNKNLRSARSDP